MLKIRTQINTAFPNGLKTQLCLNHFTPGLLTLVLINESGVNGKTLVLCKTKALAESLRQRLRARNSSIQSSITNTKLLDEWDIPNRGKGKIRWILVIKNCDGLTFDWLLSQDLSQEPPKNHSTWGLAPAKPLPHHADLPINKPALVLPTGSWARVISEIGGDLFQVGRVESVRPSGATLKLGNTRKFFLWPELLEVDSPHSQADAA